ncbi:MAG: hypothetical protein M1118_00560 [Chloroflexi bacterium]|nr:hypothetical protein [Chloroflexota bacterium]
MTTKKQTICGDELPLRVTLGGVICLYRSRLLGNPAYRHIKALAYAN